MSETPSNKPIQPPILGNAADKDIVDRALSLFTFYEGRVQTAKSILVGILSGVISLQIPIFLDKVINKLINKKPEGVSLFDFLSIFFLFVVSLIVFLSISRHMSVNNANSKYFKDILDSKDIPYRKEGEPQGHWISTHLHEVLLWVTIALVAISLIAFAFSCGH